MRPHQQLFCTCFAWLTWYIPTPDWDAIYWECWMREAMRSDVLPNIPGY